VPLDQPAPSARRPADYPKHDHAWIGKAKHGRAWNWRRLRPQASAADIEEGNPEPVQSNLRRSSDVGPATKMASVFASAVQQGQPIQALRLLANFQPRSFCDAQSERGATCLAGHVEAANSAKPVATRPLFSTMQFVGKGE
jgi:hypothetical protein